RSARLANLLAVIETLEHREEPGVALDFAREGVEVARAGMRGERSPFRRGALRCNDRGIDVRLAALRDAREHGLRGRIDRLEVHTLGGCHAAASNEVPEPARS